MAIKIPYDPVKAAQVNSLILSGVDPEQAFQKIGIPEDEYDAYQVSEDANGKLSVGQSGTTTRLDEAERADLQARKAAEAAEIKATLAENARKKEEAIQQAAEARKLQEEADKKAYLSEEATQSRDAARSDYRAQRQAFLQSQGLENADAGTQLKAITKASNTRDADGNSTFDKFKTTAAQDALAEKEAKQSAAGQTAEAKVVNDQPPAVSGAGQGNLSTTPEAATPEALSADEEAKLAKSNNGTTARELTATQEPNGTSTSTSTPKSEAGSAETATKDATQTEGKDTVDASVAPASAVVPAALYYNKLHDFTGYTYKITLWLLTAEDYQKISSKPDSFTPTHCLISSGGGIPSVGTSAQSARHPDFQEDFYFDNLSMSTIVGLNAKTKASNAVDIKFTIVEPYGMTLLDRLLSACQTSASCTNYVDQPYLLQIDFLSNPIEANQSGAQGYVIDSKRIPIKFMEFKIKPGAGGTSYFVKAMPYNHLGFIQSVAAVPTPINVTAKTVGEYFDSQKDAALLFSADAIDQQNRIESEINKLDIGSIGEEELIALRSRLKAEISNVNSFPNGYNTFFKNAAYKAKRTNFPVNLLLFAIDPVIASSLIVDVEKSEARRGVFATPTYSALAGTATASAGPDFKNKSVFHVLAGTSVIEVINKIVSASEYIKNQVKKPETDTEQATQTDITTSEGDARTVSANGYNKLPTPSKTKKIEYKPTDWFKIIPTVNLGNFDKVTNSYSKVITYTILRYNAANAYHTDFALTKIAPTQVSRTYNYYYTGLNQDIINLDIDFDATFVTGIATFTKQMESSNSNTSADKTVDKEPAYDWTNSLPIKKVVTPADTQYNPQNKTAEDYSVSSVSRSLYSAYPRGDMLNIRVKIVGDPAFIKQDDIYQNPMQSGYGNFVKKVAAAGSPPINDQGQIIFDHEEVYVQLIFKSAVDIDDITGITNKNIKLSNGQVTNGTFSGLYKVMTVDSEFKQGKFEQTLSLIRMPDSMLDKAAEPAANGSKVATTAQTASTAAADNANSVKPAAAVANSPVAQDATLKSIADGAATSPVPTVAGAGTTAAADQPSTAAAANVNATQVDIQEQPIPDNTVAVQELAAAEEEVKLLYRTQETGFSQFNSGLRKIVLNDELTQVEKDKQVLAYRQSYIFGAVLDADAVAGQYKALVAKVDAIVSGAAPGAFRAEAQALRIKITYQLEQLSNGNVNNREAIMRLKGR